jgi:hypothetical protein
VLGGSSTGAWVAARQGALTAVAAGLFSVGLWLLFRRGNSCARCREG